MSMVINLVEDHNIYLCEGGPVYNGGVSPTPITYLTQWKIVGNSEVHGQEIWSCGEYNDSDGKYHILVQPLGGSIADIALTEPLRKVNDVADTIEFPSTTEGKALVTRNVESKTVSAYNDEDGNHVVTTLPDNTILHFRNIYNYQQIPLYGNSVAVSISQREAVIKITSIGSANYMGMYFYPFGSSSTKGNVYTSCYFKNDDSKTNIIYSDRGNSLSVNSNTYIRASLLYSNLGQLRYATQNKTEWQVDDVFYVKDINIFDIDAIFADCQSLKPNSNTAFEMLFPNLGCIGTIETEVIVSNGKLYKEDVLGIEILVPLSTPTTELVDAPQIEEADSYSCVISQGGKAVSWSSFETE